MRPVTGALALAGLILGCGGGGGGVTLVDSSAFEGGYSAVFDRAGTTVLVVTDSVGGVSVALSDENGVLASGPGTVSQAGVVRASLTGVLGSVGVAGSFELLDEEPRLTLDFEGGVSAAGLTLTRFASQGVNPFAANYQGAYSGGEVGSWSISVSVRGQVTGIVRDPIIGALSVTGQVDPAGEATWTATAPSGSPPIVHQWSGRFYFVGQGVRGSGLWTSNTGVSGTWTGRRD